MVPNLGVCDLFESQTIEGDGSSLVVADIPGLLEGAHEGVSDDDDDGDDDDGGDDDGCDGGDNDGGDDFSGALKFFHHDGFIFYRMLV